MDASNINPVDTSRFIVHLPWKSVAVSVPPNDKTVLVKGTTGMRAPKGKFLALARYDDVYHPRADDHWFDMNNDHLTDQGWKVTHWCEV